MSRIYWDAMLFIYLLEKNPIHGPQVVKIHHEMLRRQDTLCTSVFTIGEVLTGPRKMKDDAGIRAIKAFFSSGEVEVLPFDMSAAEGYSTIRAEMRVSQADAIHLATAAASGIDLFISNDHRLHKLRIPGINFMADLDGKVF
jgi:predicted nucleic acid-binding protein